MLKMEFECRVTHLGEKTCIYFCNMVQMVWMDDDYISDYNVKKKLPLP